MSSVVAALRPLERYSLVNWMASFRSFSYQIDSEHSDLPPGLNIEFFVQPILYETAGLDLKLPVNDGALVVSYTKK